MKDFGQTSPDNSPDRRLSDVEAQLMWSRLISVVEEQAQTIQRTAFSTVVRESGDLAAGVFDRRGRMLAQSVTGTPGHINTMADNVGHVLKVCPPETLKEGDVMITNDPWIGTGHTNDFSIVAPVFRKGELIGYFGCNCHLMDIGGVQAMVGSTDVFMEGLLIPVLKLYEGGKLNETLMAMIRTNTRLPTETEGDVYALVNSTAVGTEGLLRMMDEFGIEDIEGLSDFIIDTSRETLLSRIRALQRGTWSYSMDIDGFDTPLTINATTTISDDGIDVDFTGTSPQVEGNINTPLCYAHAYVSFSIICAIAPDVPSNAGTLAPIRVTAPEATVVSAKYPAAVVSRHTLGLMMPDVVFGCLRTVLPERVLAEGAGILWSVRVSGPNSSPPVPGEGFLAGVTCTGGMGAYPSRDGLSATGFPAGVRGGPVEVFESMSTVVVWKKRYLPDSGGPGTWRGGLGQMIEFSNILPEDMHYYATFDRVDHPARGADGGLPGGPGLLRYSTGEEMHSKGRYLVPTGTRVTLHSPGGGGIGDPRQRDRDLVREDLAKGLISEQAAREIYGLEIEG